MGGAGIALARDAICAAVSPEAAQKLVGHEARQEVAGHRGDGVVAAEAVVEGLRWIAHVSCSLMDGMADGCWRQARASIAKATCN